jgi:uncharacterized Zn finger protein
VFLLIGMRPFATVLFVVTFVCGHCGTAAQQRIIREQEKLTLFFIPLLSMRTSWFVECDHCGRATALTREQAEHGMQWAATHDRAVA